MINLGKISVSILLFICLWNENVSAQDCATEIQCSLTYNSVNNNLNIANLIDQTLCGRSINTTDISLFFVEIVKPGDVVLNTNFTANQAGNNISENFLDAYAWGPFTNQPNCPTDLSTANSIACFPDPDGGGEFDGFFFEIDCAQAGAFYVIGVSDFTVADASLPQAPNEIIIEQSNDPLASGNGSIQGCIDLTDKDNDGVPDTFDLDDDNDGILDENECPEDNFQWSNAPTVASTNTATGTINGVNYTYTSANPILTTTNLFGHGNFPASYGIPNQTSIRNNLAGCNTITFATPVTNPSLVFASIGRSTLFVPITFSNPISIEYGQNVVQNSATQITGNEGYAIVNFSGEFTSIEFCYLADESYVNFLFGFELCDTDGDGLSNFVDNDSDNDGIPDAIEACGNIALNLESCNLDNNADATYIDDPNFPGCSLSTGVVDGVNNCANNPIDTDGDGTPDFLDLDSDNDGCPDAEEAETNGESIDNYVAGNVNECGLLIQANGTTVCDTPPNTNWINAVELELICPTNLKVQCDSDIPNSFENLTQFYNGGGNVIFQCPDITNFQLINETTQ